MWDSLTWGSSKFIYALTMFNRSLMWRFESGAVMDIELDSMASAQFFKKNNYVKQLWAILRNTFTSLELHISLYVAQFTQLLLARVLLSSCVWSLVCQITMQRPLGFRFTCDRPAGCSSTCSCLFSHSCWSWTSSCPCSFTQQCL